MQTGGAINQQQLWGSGWSSQLLLWEQQIQEQINMNTSEGKQQGPTGVAVSPFETKTNSGADSKHSTTPPRIRVTKSNRRLIDEGEYEDALCVNAYHRWNRQYKRWEAIVEFVFQAPVPQGAPIPMHVRLGDGPEPELPDHHWLFNLLLKLDKTGNIDVAALHGHYFDVTVATIKKQQGQRAERAASQWYSRVRQMSLSSDSFYEYAAQQEMDKANRE